MTLTLSPKSSLAFVFMAKGPEVVTCDSILHTVIWGKVEVLKQGPNILQPMCWAVTFSSMGLHCTPLVGYFVSLLL